LVLDGIAFSPDRAGQWIVQLLPILRRVKSETHANLQSGCQTADSTGMTSIAREITRFPAENSLLNNVSGRVGMIKYAACAGRSSLYPCHRPKGRSIDSLYEMRRRIFMTVCNKKINLP
jgi:hypothetical protein